ncbi:MAG: hypothetical protein ACT4PM_02990 [Gemmatimonadales bacterium]
MRWSARGLVLAALLAAGGCAQTFDATTLGVPVSMGEAAGETVPGTPFQANTHTVHAFWGLITVSRPNLRKALARQLIGGDEIRQLSIKSRSRFADVLLTIFTAGLVVPRTVTYQGVVIER